MSKILPSVRGVTGADVFGVLGFFVCGDLGSPEEDELVSECPCGFLVGFWVGPWGPAVVPDGPAGPAVVPDGPWGP